MEQTTKTVRTRFAPSPTGMLHIGGLRTALFGWLWARKHRGQFIVRLEDTDRIRLVDGAKEQILNSIADLGMDWDFGPDKPGPFGSCIQSERLMTYQDQIEVLLKAGIAYRDWRTSEELEALRAEGYGGLIYETVNANSLSAFVKEQMAENDDTLPDWLNGLVNVFEKTTVGVRKAAKR